MNIEKFVDKRGWLTQMNKDIVGLDFKHIILGSIEPGNERGNHYHKRKEEVFVCFEGTIEVIFKSSKGESKTILKGENMESIFVPTDVCHTLKNIGDSTAKFIGLVNEIFIKDAPDTYSDVDRLLNEK